MHAKLAGMSSTVTTPNRRGAPPPSPPHPQRAQVPPEVAAFLDASETDWVTPQEFSERRAFGWRDRSVLQKAADRNACGLKDARRRRTGTARAIWEYPVWRVKLYLQYGLDGSGPTYRRRSKRQITTKPKEHIDRVVVELAALTHRDPLQVLRDVANGELEATLHPTEDRVLFLDAESARRWINRQASLRRG